MTNKRLPENLFTLIELLVSTTCQIGVLPLYLFKKTIRKMPYNACKAKATKCVNNLKQIGHGFMNYAEDSGWLGYGNYSTYGYNTKIRYWGLMCKTTTQPSLGYVDYDWLPNGKAHGLLACPSQAAKHDSSGWGNVHYAISGAVGSQEVVKQAADTNHSLFKTLRIKQPSSSFYLTGKRISRTMAHQADSGSLPPNRHNMHDSAFFFDQYVALIRVFPSAVTLPEWWKVQ